MGYFTRNQQQDFLTADPELTAEVPPQRPALTDCHQTQTRQVSWGASMCRGSLSYSRPPPPLQKHKKLLGDPGAASASLTLRGRQSAAEPQAGRGPRGWLLGTGALFSENGSLKRSGGVRTQDTQLRPSLWQFLQEAWPQLCLLLRKPHPTEGALGNPRGVSRDGGLFSHTAAVSRSLKDGVQTAGCHPHSSLPTSHVEAAQERPWSLTPLPLGVTMGWKEQHCHPLGLSEENRVL